MLRYCCFDTKLQFKKDLKSYRVNTNTVPCLDGYCGETTKVYRAKQNTLEPRIMAIANITTGNDTAAPIPSLPLVASHQHQHRTKFEKATTEKSSRNVEW